MGLDITAYAKVELKAADLQREAAWYLVDELYDQGIRTVAIYDSPEFTERAAPLVAPAAGLCNVYAIDGEMFEFRAGSYRGHGHFRRWLCTLAGIAAPEEQWAHPDKYAPLPFHELVNFSDCEGVIGSVACAELAKDFAAYQKQADAYNGGDAEYWQRVYSDWRKAFELAQHGGVVVFG